MNPTSVLVLDNHVKWLSDIQREIQAHTNLRCVPLFPSKDLLPQVRAHCPAVIVLNSSSESCTDDMNTLRSCEETKCIPLVVVSAEVDDLAKAKAYTYGCIDFIVSPDDGYKELVSKVEGYGCLGLIDIKIKKLMRIYK